MNMLGGKRVDVVADIPDITNAKLVEVRWDRFYMGDGEYVLTACMVLTACVWSGILIARYSVSDTDRLTALPPTVGKRTVAEWERCPDYPLTMTSPRVTRITTDMLSRLH